MGFIMKKFLTVFTFFFAVVSVPAQTIFDSWPNPIDQGNVLVVDLQTALDTACASSCVLTGVRVVEGHFDLDISGVAESVPFRLAMPGTSPSGPDTFAAVVFMHGGTGDAADYPVWQGVFATRYNIASLALNYTNFEFVGGMPSYGDWQRRNEEIHEVVLQLQALTEVNASQIGVWGQSGGSAAALDYCLLYGDADDIKTAFLVHSALPSWERTGGAGAMQWGAFPKDIPLLHIYGERDNSCGRPFMDTMSSQISTYNIDLWLISNFGMYEDESGGLFWVDDAHGFPTRCDEPGCTATIDLAIRHGDWANWQLCGGAAPLWLPQLQDELIHTSESLAP